MVIFNMLSLIDSELRVNDKRECYEIEINYCQTCPPHCCRHSHQSKIKITFLYSFSHQREDEKQKNKKSVWCCALPRSSLHIDLHFLTNNVKSNLSRLQHSTFFLHILSDDDFYFSSFFIIWLFSFAKDKQENRKKN